jgi:hypothetical protein
MAELINLNHARKQRARKADKAAATENRAAFGRTRQERDLAAGRTEKARRDLDARKREE